MWMIPFLDASLNEVSELIKYVKALGTGTTIAHNHTILQGITEPHKNANLIVYIFSIAYIDNCF